MSASILSLNDDTLVLILRKAIASGSPCLEDALHVCKRFRNALLAAATSARVTSNNPTLLRHCASLRSVTLVGCSRLPWALDTRGGIPCVVPLDLSHLSGLTLVDASRACVQDSEMEKLRCLPELQHLHVSKGLSESGLRQLSALTSLRHLDLSGCTRLSADSLSHISSLTSLESLDFRGSLSPADDCVAHATGLTALTRLDFRPHSDNPDTCTLTERGLSCLARLKQLRFLELRGILRRRGPFPALHHLSGLRSLEVLDLSDCSFPQDEPPVQINLLAHSNLAFLSCLICLQTLNLHSGVPFDLNKSFAYITGLMRLRDLMYNPGTLNDEGMLHLAQLTALTALDLQWSKDISEDGYAQLRRFSSLRKVSLCDRSKAKIKAALSHLASLEHLHEIDGLDMVDGVFELVCELRSLKHLYLDRHASGGLEGLPHVTKLPALEQLGMCGCRTDMEWILAPVTTLTTLTQLGLRGEHRARGKLDLARLSALRKLQVLRLELHESDVLGDLSGLSRLTRLEVWDCNNITHLTMPSRLQHVEFLRCIALTDAALAALSGLPHLAHLSLAHCARFTGASFEHLQQMTALTALKMTFCSYFALDEPGRLPALRSLKELKLLGCNLRDGRAMAALSCLRSLTRLDGIMCFVSDEVLSYLARLPSLAHLDLGGGPLSAAGLAHVARISSLTCLQLLNCDGLRVEHLAPLSRLGQLDCLAVCSKLVPDMRALLRGTVRVVSSLYDAERDR